MLIEESKICNVFVFLSPKLPLKQPCKHLHVKKLFEERFLVSFGLLFILQEVEASSHAINCLSILPTWLLCDKVFFVGLKNAHEKVKEAHSDLLNVLSRESLLLLALVLYHFLYQFG